MANTASEDKNSGMRWLTPQWPAPGGVRALVTTRTGGVSDGVYASLNLGAHVNDTPSHVQRNRDRLVKTAELPGYPCWLEQTHSARVIQLPETQDYRADAAWTTATDCICTVMTADCLPVLLTDRAGGVAAAVHAGWRGMVAGILENTVKALPVPSGQLLAWLGPAIGPDHYQVGAEVYDTFIQHGKTLKEAFVADETPGRFYLDLYKAATMLLHQAGVHAIYGGGFCTFEDQRFYSYRRDGTTGRFASLIYLSSAPLNNDAQKGTGT